MATVCGGTLALMDAGVRIKAPVAGVAMGLGKEGETYAVLTDIAGAGDHYGDMDCKVAGTRDGITERQTDIEIPGVTTHIMSEALAWKSGRHRRFWRICGTVSGNRRAASHLGNRRKPNPKCPGCAAGRRPGDGQGRWPGRQQDQAFAKSRFTRATAEAVAVGAVYDRPH